MIRVGEQYKPDSKWNGEYLRISSYKPDPREVLHYNAKRTYYAHAVYGTGAFFIGRYFSLKKARDAIKTYIAKYCG